MPGCVLVVGRTMMVIVLEPDDQSGPEARSQPPLPSAPLPSPPATCSTPLTSVSDLQPPEPTVMRLPASRSYKKTTGRCSLAVWEITWPLSRFTSTIEGRLERILHRVHIPDCLRAASIHPNKQGVYVPFSSTAM